MKKFTTKLLMSIIAVAFAFVALGTSTYAWFSMNTQVTVSSMELVAKSDNTYLLVSDIAEVDNSGDQTKPQTHAEQIQAAGAITVTWDTSATKVLPSAPAQTADEAAYLPANTGKTVADAAIETAGVQVTNKATAAAVTNWYTAIAETSAAATMKAGSARQLTTFEGYVLVKTVYLTVAKGANGANNLKVSGTFTQKGEGNDVTAAKVLVATSDGGFAVLDSTNCTNVDIKGSNHYITDDTVLTVDMYIYYDGNDSHVYTNNAANLTGATISLTFDVNAQPGA